MLRRSAPRNLERVFRALRPAQLVVDVALAMLFAVVMVPVEALLIDDATTSSAGAVTAALILALALAVRRLAPGLSLAGAWLAAIVQMLSQLSPRPSDLAIFAVLYVTAAYGGRIVYWLGLASAVVGALVITGYLALLGVTTFSYSSLPTAIAILIAALFALLLAWTAGALVRMAIRAQESRRARELAEADAATEQERVRIARDMHDVVAHSLAVVIAQADGARYAAASDPAATGDALSTISATARSALTDVRQLLAQLRQGSAPDDAGAPPRPQPTLTEVEALYAQVRAAGVDLRVEVDPAPPGTPPAAVQLAVYRILQEALTNALRHGAGAPVAVHLAWLADRVEVEVRNATATETAPQGGHGLIGMRERAQLAGGRLDARPVDGEFVVRASLPVGVAS